MSNTFPYTSPNNIAETSMKAVPQLPELIGKAMLPLFTRQPEDEYVKYDFVFV